MLAKKQRTAVGGRYLTPVNVPATAAVADDNRHYETAKERMARQSAAREFDADIAAMNTPAGMAAMEVAMLTASTVMRKKKNKNLTK